MAEVRIQSIQRPFDDPEVARLGISVVMRADAMGLLTPRAIDRLDLDEWERVARDVSEAGIGQGLFVAHTRTHGLEPDRFRAMLQHVNEALDASPVPASEWPALHRVLGPDLLARLLNISTVSLRRYQSGTRTTPDDVVTRLHVLALMVGDLAGAYNEAGIRRWFVRPRTMLGNRAPGDVLTAGWQPEDRGPRQVRDLANALTAFPVT
jgi:uncharacterized protein (DUF2384 family)